MRLSMITKQRLAGFLFTVPALALFGAFAVYPIVQTLYLSLFQYDLLTPARFTGLRNFLHLRDDVLFLVSIKNTLVYVAGSYVPTWIIALSLALVLNHAVRMRNFIRMLYFVPVVMSMVVVAVIWKLIFHPYGLLNTALGPIMEEPIFWLTSATYAPFALMIMTIWKNVGYHMVLFLAGLQAIPFEYYEAGRIDGTTMWTAFRHITLPLLKPTAVFVIIISLIEGMRTFIPQFVMTGGGPGDATRVIALNIYQTAFVFLKMGLASSMAVILFIILLAITLLQIRIFKGLD